MTYEVQHFTLCDGWVNSWIVHQPDGSSAPETFATRGDAETALADFLQGIEDEIACGKRDADWGYAPEDFRVVAINPPQKCGWQV